MSIKSKLTFLFLALALIPLIFVSVITFSNYKKSLEAARFSQLRDIAAFKADKIETYFNGLKAHMQVAQGYYNIKKNLPVLTRLAAASSDPEFAAAKKTLDDQLQQIEPVLRLADIMLVGPEGRVVYTSNPAHHSSDFLKLLPDSQQKVFAEGRKKVYFSDIFLNKERANVPEMFVTAPASDFDGVFIGVIVFEVDMGPMYDFIQDATGLGHTGETLVAKKIGNEVLYLNPRRHDPQAALSRRITIGDRIGRPMQQAVQGGSGVGLSLDYRGKTVVSAWRYIPSLDWGVVAKIDSEEVFRDVINLRNLVLMILLIVSALSAVIGISIAQSVSGPIKQISKGAQIIGSGNLDYKLGSNAKDEIGQLSRAFDKMTQDLKTTTAYARSLIEASLDPLVTISLEGKITDVNEATIKATSLPREQLIGTDFSNYFIEPQKAREGYQQVFAKGSVTDYPLTIRHKDGRLTDFLYNASVYRDTRGNVLGVFAAARDVTVQKQAEAELKRHRDNLEVLVKERTSELHATNTELLRSNENLEQFAYVASHDLQEPLRAMASYSQLLERRYKNKLDQDADDFIAFIVDAANRMQRLINDLLSYSRIGRKDGSLTEVDCNVVLRKVLESMAAIIESGNGRVTFEPLPVLKGYESGFVQLFQNLIGNALKFRGKEPPLIHISVKQNASECEFCVKDNGIGIDPQYKEKIFLIFQRLHSKEEYPGTGIGLSICKKIVENYGGRIWVESEPQKGSSFYFTVPVKGGKNG